MRRRNRFATACFIALAPAAAPAPSGGSAGAAPLLACSTIVAHDPDINDDGDVGIADLLEVLACWGPVLLMSCQDANLLDTVGCDDPARNDVDDVNINDLLFLLSNWG